VTPPTSIVRDSDRAAALRDDLDGALILGPDATTYQVAVLACARAEHLAAFAGLLGNVDDEASPLEVWNVLMPMVEDVQMLVAEVERRLRK